MFAASKEDTSRKAGTLKNACMLFESSNYGDSFSAGVHLIGGKRRKKDIRPVLKEFLWFLLFLCLCFLIVLLFDYICSRVKATC